MKLPISDLRRPPGPEGSVTLGVDPETLTLLQNLQADYGNFVSMTTVEGRQAVFINDAEAVRKLLVRHYDRYRKGPGFERVKILLGNGLIVSDGALWRRARTMIQPAFSRPNLHSLVALIVRCSQRIAGQWERTARDGGQINITRAMSDFALELILRAIFGLDYERSIVSGGENPFAFLSSDSTRDLRMAMRLHELRTLLLGIIERRRVSAVAEQYDFLGQYLLATDKHGKAFSDKELLDELMTLIVAGYETSAGTLNWAWYLLAGHPKVERKLLAEIDDLIEEPSLVDQRVVTEMHYAQQLLEETLRLYPPVWLFTRRAEGNDTLTDYDIAADTDVYLSPYIMHRTQAYWSDPERFDPDRFDGRQRQAKEARAYFPFSLGPRRCLGEYFSFLEMKIHLAILVKKFHMSLVDTKTPKLELGINLRTREDIFLRPRLRGAIDDALR